MPNLDELFSRFQISETIRIDAPPERVWALITDVRRIVDFSPECIRVQWIGGATGAEVGARFAGTSRVGAFEWTRNCTIVEVRERRLFSYEAWDEPDEAPQSRWSFEITEDDAGTVLQQRFSHVPAGRSTVRLMAESDPAGAESTIAERRVMLIDGTRRTLEAMREALTRGVDDPP